MLDGLHQQPSAVGLPSADALAGTVFASAGLSDEERQALEAAAVRQRAVRANVDLVREGEAVDSLYLVTEGWAGRYRTTREGHRQIVGLAVPGDVANLDAVIFGRPDYGVRTLDAATLVALPRERVAALAVEHAGIGTMLTRLAIVENAILGQWALCLGRKSALQRVAHLFCEFGVRLGRDGAAAARFDMPLTQEQLADVLGLTPVHVNRMVQRLRSDGLIASAGRRMTVPDVAALRAVAEFDPAYLHAPTTGAARDRPRDARPAGAPSAALS